MKRLGGILLLATLTGLLCVYEEVEAVKIGYEIRRQEQVRALALDRTRALKYNIARLEAPETLERRLAAQKIKLAAPQSWQTLPSHGFQGHSAGPRAATRSWFTNPPFFTKLFLGTAQAEAKETSR